MRHTISKLIADITKFICRVNVPYSQKQMSFTRCQEIIRRSRPTDLILLRTEGELSTLIQGQKWTHSVPVSYFEETIEAVTSGVRRVSLMYVLARCDEAILLRPKKEVTQFLFCQFLNAQIGEPYDFEFSDSDSKWYCHHLSAWAYKSSSEIKIEKVKTALGEKFMPDSFLTSEFEIIC